jgi:hypothetical protein
MCRLATGIVVTNDQSRYVIPDLPMRAGGLAEGAPQIGPATESRGSAGAQRASYV